MKRSLAICVACAVVALPSLAHAYREPAPVSSSSNSHDVFDNPGVMVGLAFKFGGAAPSTKDIGITAKILSNRNEDTFVLGAGVTFYPMEPQSFGLDISAGYNFDNATIMGGFDFLQKTPQLSIGWSNTDKDDPTVITPLPPV